jgi:anti-sigma B factor antagonist
MATSGHETRARRTAVVVDRRAVRGGIGVSQSPTTFGVRRIGKAGVVDVEGSLTADSAEALADAFARASVDGARAIVLNFGRMDYMNSSGIGLLVTLLARANRQQQRLLACGLSAHYRHIFELTHLSEVIGVYDDEAGAVAAAAVL